MNQDIISQVSKSHGLTPTQKFLLQAIYNANNEEGHVAIVISGSVQKAYTSNGQNEYYYQYRVLQALIDKGLVKVGEWGVNEWDCPLAKSLSAHDESLKGHHLELTEILAPKKEEVKEDSKISDYYVRIDEGDWTIAYLFSPSDITIEEKENGMCDMKFADEQVHMSQLMAKCIKAEVDKLFANKPEKFGFINIEFFALTITLDHIAESCFSEVSDSIMALSDFLQDATEEILSAIKGGNSEGAKNSLTVKYNIKEEVFLYEPDEQSFIIASSYHPKSNDGGLIYLPKGGDAAFLYSGNYLNSEQLMKDILHACYNPKIDVFDIDKWIDENIHF